MRRRFEQQLELGMVAIGEVEIDKKSRHQLPPMLRAMQHIFVEPSLNEALFEVLEAKILSGKQATGRLGMSLWEIFVLASTRLNLNVDYDFLYDLANNHKSLRGILGVDRNDFQAGKQYHPQTLKDNVSLLDEATIRSLNELVVQAAHGVIKKKDEAKDLSLSIKVDSYVVESNIHFPTDLSLLWDSARKVLDVVEDFLESGMSLAGVRKHKYLRRKLKRVYRKTSEIHRKKGKNYKKRLRQSCRAYLEQARQLEEKAAHSIETVSMAVVNAEASLPQCSLLQQLQYYHKMLKKFIDLTHRRIMRGEKIPHQEKLFSIFEPHVEWINKGKAHKNVELGHPLCIATDQYHFVVDFEIMFEQSDPAAGMEIGKRLIQNYGQTHTLSSISFDRGFYSKLLRQVLEKDFQQVVLPKPGYKSAAQQSLEQEETFVQLQQAHSTVEANIHQLESNGLDTCPDKGEDGFRRYVALGVVAYNLQRLGNLLLNQDRQQHYRKKAA